MRYKLINNGVQHLTSPLFPCCTNVGSKLKMGKVDSQKRFCSYFHAYIMFMFVGKNILPDPTPLRLRRLCLKHYENILFEFNEKS